MILFIQSGILIPACHTAVPSAVFPDGVKKEAAPISRIQNKQTTTISQIRLFIFFSSNDDCLPNHSLTNSPNACILSVTLKAMLYAIQPLYFPITK